MFLDLSFVLATQTNSKSGEDVSQIVLEPEWFVEKSAVKSDIEVEKKSTNWPVSESIQFV